MNGTRNYTLIRRIRRMVSRSPCLHSSNGIASLGVLDVSLTNRLDWVVYTVVDLAWHCTAGESNG